MTEMDREVHVFGDTDALHLAAAHYIAAAAASAIAQRGRFLLVLAGGATPEGVYARLGAAGDQPLDRERIHLFWGDERCVPPTHAESNYGMAARSLLARLNLPSERIHRIQGELPAAQAAAQYDTELAAFFGAATPEDLGPQPAFDLVLLGMGEDGHTASLFPGSRGIGANCWAVAARAPEPAGVRDRVTLTLPAINAARACLFLVTGEAKREAATQVFGARSRGDRSGRLPAARVRPRERNLWFLDVAAGGSLSR